MLTGLTRTYWVYELSRLIFVMRDAECCHPDYPAMLILINISILSSIGNCVKITNKDFGDLQGFYLCPVLVLLCVGYIVYVFGFSCKQDVSAVYISHVTVGCIIALHGITSLFSYLR